MGEKARSSMYSQGRRLSTAYLIPINNILINNSNASDAPVSGQLLSLFDVGEAAVVGI